MTEQKSQELLEYVSAGNRVCPQPQQWDTLWKMLPDRKRTGNSYEPPAPLILSVWWESDDNQKRQRLVEHI